MKLRYITGGVSWRYLFYTDLVIHNMKKSWFLISVYSNMTLGLLWANISLISFILQFLKHKIAHAFKII